VIEMMERGGDVGIFMISSRASKEIGSDLENNENGTGCVGMM
jgi:hypothetical protein